ncbi:unnamed protein product [Eruca vesicaria subsp. sativa]|uniref:Uncharacterized protein n=1 Tax=Eruca vesicaria subsp. sativa TaxID=29727 RepID=A0ABC8KBV6_ERUVS|nr:unnamed protein product [Eruca vesicaria subsp. sativa]
MPPLSDITLLCTFGAKRVAEFHFLCRSDFTIGASTYVVGEGQDEATRARYERLVLGERLVVSEGVMKEVFGEEEMAILHRVALEMAYADRILGRGSNEGVVRRMEIIQLDDDAEMADVSQAVASSEGTVAENRGTIVTVESQQLTPTPASEAPSVVWDVGLDLFDYPEMYNSELGRRKLAEDAAFWEAVIQANLEDDEEVMYIASHNEIRVGLASEGRRQEGNGEGSSSSANVICSPLVGADVTTKEKEVGSNDNGVTEVIELDADEGGNSNMPAVTVTVAGASASTDGQKEAGHKSGNTSSEGSDNDGGS